MYRIHHRRLYGNLTPPPDYTSEDRFHHSGAEDSDGNSAISSPHANNHHPHCGMNRGRSYPGDMYTGTHQSHQNNNPGYDRYVCFKDTSSSLAAAAGNLPCSCYPHHHPPHEPYTYPHSCAQHQHQHQATDPRIRRHIHYHKHYGSHSPSPRRCSNRYLPPYQDWSHTHGNHHRLPHARCHCSQCTRLVPEGGVGCQGYATCGGLNGGYGGGCGYGVGNGYGGCSGRRVYGPPLPVFVMGVPRRGCIGR